MNGGGSPLERVRYTLKRVAARHISEDTHVEMVSMASNNVLVIYRGDSELIEK